MLAVRGQNVNDVQIELEQLVVIGKYLRARNAEFLRGLLCALFNDVAERDHLHVVQLLERGHMLAVRNAAAADDADSYLVHVNLLLL